MRIVLQKVTQAAVSVGGKTVGQIGRGYLLFVGIAEGDTERQAQELIDKIVRLRLFPGPDGKINDRSLLEAGGSALVVSQFTLLGNTEKGNRPDYTAAAPREQAQELYEHCIALLRERGVTVEHGAFGAHMEVMLTNDGPVTLLLARGAE